MTIFIRLFRIAEIANENIFTINNLSNVIEKQKKYALITSYFLRFYKFLFSTILLLDKFLFNGFKGGYVLNLRIFFYGCLCFISYQ